MKIYNWKFPFMLVAGLMAGAAAVHAAEIKILCANSMEVAMLGVADIFRGDTGHRAELVFDISPAIVKRVSAGEPADLMILAQRSFDEVEKAGKVVAGSRAVVGRIGIGLAVRTGVAAPDISTPDALKRAVLGADSLASTELGSGTYFAGLLESLGIAGEVKGKSKRYTTFGGVIEHVLKGKERDIGVGLITDILANKEKGLTLVGPLPAEIQNYGAYVAGLTTNAKSPEAARAFVKFLATLPAIKALAATGVDQPK